MNQALPPKREALAARQLRQERAKRGLIAGYLHGLSDRHAAARPRSAARPTDGLTTPSRARDSLI
jgi:hypothetical protein